MFIDVQRVVIRVDSQCPVDIKGGVSSGNDFYLTFPGNIECGLNPFQIQIELVRFIIIKSRAFSNRVIGKCVQVVPVDILLDTVCVVKVSRFIWRRFAI